MRWIIAGGRDFADYDRLRDVAAHFFAPGDALVSGAARGADKLGEQFANECGFEIDRHPADWDRLGKGAGYARNHQMSLVADGLIAFWDGYSKGTKNMIENAHAARLETHVYYYQGSSHD